MNELVMIRNDVQRGIQPGIVGTYNALLVERGDNLVKLRMAITKATESKAEICVSGIAQAYRQTRERRFN